MLWVELVICMFVLWITFRSFEAHTLYVRILLTVAHNNHARYFATFCIVSGTYTTIGLTIAWCRSSIVRLLYQEYCQPLILADAHNLGSETKKATGIPMFMAIGQCGSVLGSHLFPKTDGPRYM